MEKGEGAAKPWRDLRSTLALRVLSYIQLSGVILVILDPWMPTPPIRPF